MPDRVSIFVPTGARMKIEGLDVLVEVLRLRPGDVLVFKLPHRMNTQVNIAEIKRRSDEMAERIGIFDLQVWVLDADCEIQVLRRD